MRVSGGDSFIWYVLLLIVGCGAILLPVSPASVFVTYAAAIVSVVLAAVVIRRVDPLLVGGAVAISACAIASMSYSFATSLSDRELQARLAEGKAELEAASVVITSYQNEHGGLPGSGDWPVALSDGGKYEDFWLSEVYSVPLLYQNASLVQSVTAQRLRPLDDVSAIHIAPDVYIWSPGVHLDAAEVGRRHCVKLVGHITLYVVLLIVLAGIAGTLWSSKGGITLLQWASPLGMAIIIVAVLLLATTWLGYRSPGYAVGQYRVEGYVWGLQRTHMYHTLLTYEDEMISRYAEAGLLSQPALEMLQQALENAPEIQPPESVSRWGMEEK